MDAGRGAHSPRFSLPSETLRFTYRESCGLQDDQLRAAVAKYDSKSWKKIAACLPGRTDVQCLHRWQKVRCITVGEEFRDS